MSQKKTYPGIDFFKLIAAFFVVMIHTRPGLGLEGIALHFYRMVCILGVPFFFCCSGFFLFPQLSQKRKFPLKQIKRLIAFYCIWTIIYLPLIIQSGESVKTIILSFFIYGSYYHLWYIPALIICTILISIIRNNKILIFLSLSIFIIEVLGSCYYELIKEVPFLNNFFIDFHRFDNRRIFTIGLPFTFLGFYIAENMNAIWSFLNKKIDLLLIAAFSLFLIEIGLGYYFALIPNSFTTFSLLPLIMLLFFKGLHFPLKNTENTQKRAFEARAISNCIYFIHPLVIYFLSIALVDTPLGANFIFICISVYFISMMIGWSIIKINNPVLNKLIR